MHLFITLWLLFAGPLWAVIGGYFIPRRYREQGLADTGVRPISIVGGFAAGAIILPFLWTQMPDWRRTKWPLFLSLLSIAELYLIFAITNPDNPCVALPFAPTYVSQQIVNGLMVGVIYAIIAVGLTLIYSVQGIVNFAHGQLYMIGGYFSYYFLQYGNQFLQEQGLVAEGFTINPLWGVPVAGVLTFIVGGIFEYMFIRPMHSGKIERAAEYAILITFGFGFFLEYTTLAIVGPFSQRADRFSSTRLVQFGEVALDGETVFGPINLLADRAVALVVGLILIFALLWFLQRTWFGRGLRAVSQDKEAAAVTGVNPLRMNTVAFAIGSLLAGMSGAILIPIFAWVPWVGAETAVRAYVVVVLGGLGSVPGALLGGLIVGIVETLGAGCYPDASRGAAYKEAFALAIFALLLLLRPQGLFGRKE